MASQFKNIQGRSTSMICGCIHLEPNSSKFNFWPSYQNGDYHVAPESCWEVSLRIIVIQQQRRTAGLSSKFCSAGNPRLSVDPPRLWAVGRLAPGMRSISDPTRSLGWIRFIRRVGSEPCSLLASHHLCHHKGNSRLSS